MQDASPLPKTACGGTLKNTAGYPSAIYDGKRVYFCSHACLYAYEEDRDRFIAGDIEHPKEHDMHSDQYKKEKTMETTFKDPVCDMDVTPETAAGKSEYQEQTYYFCAPGCKRSFDKDPEKYLHKDKESESAE